MKLSRKAIALTVSLLTLALILTAFTGTNEKGIVFKPDGTPAARVTIYVVGGKDGVYVQGSPIAVREEMQGRTRKTITDKDGRFSFRLRNDDHSIIIFDDAGFAQMRVEEFVKGHEILLRSWARVEGKLMVGDKSFANENVRLWPAHVPYENHPREFPPLNLFLTTRTKADGTFVFERVPPFKVEVYHSPLSGRKNISGITPRAQSQKLVLKPGATTQVTLGGKGRPLIGRVALKGHESEFNWRDDTYTMTSNPPLPAGLPDLLAESKRLSNQTKAAMGKPIEERKAIFDAIQAEQNQSQEKARLFYQSESGWNYHAAQLHYAMRFQEDGRFRIEDVPGGPYAINLHLRDTAGQFIAGIEKTFVIPDSPGGRTDEPFDIGIIEVSTPTRLKIGQAAPDFETRTVDGKPLKLSDFKGKFVLLDFWAVWCGPCVRETPHLKETYEALKNDPRFVMIGLSLDLEADVPAQYAKKNQLGWIQGFLGEWDKTKIPNQFGVQGIPAIFLIGPDGKILQRDLRGEAIKSVVKSTLASAKP